LNFDTDAIQWANDRIPMPSDSLISVTSHMVDINGNRQSSMLMTIDVEDWFQVENLRGHFPLSSWNSCQLRVERNTHQLLDLLDAVRACGGESPPVKPRATFFVLGWIAQRARHLVREIHARGHEIASHGFSHELSGKHSADELKEDLITSKRLLEDMIGAPVNGYRAPSFSVSPHVLKIIEECGYMYDSSYNSFTINQRYGTLDLSGKPKKGIAYRISQNLYELPISNAKVFGCVLPAGGGAYFRLIPTRSFHWLVKSILKSQEAYVFYLHPWEVDPHQPRIDGLKRSSAFRHYTNLHKTMPKLSRLLDSFCNSKLVSCHQYITNLEAS
jgi:polysaccharide deacetylase family protein (PEP-CTERM system associated)